MIPHIEESGEACIVVAISTEGRKKAAAVMGTVSLGNKSIKGVAKVREANKDKPPLQKFMEQTPKLILPTDDILKKELVDGHEVKLWISRSSGEMGVSVDDSYIRKDISPQEGKRVTFQALRMVKSEVAKMPDGTLLKNTPTTKDGLGNSRERLYERAGFGPIFDEVMMSVVKNGKLTPITSEQHRYLMRNGHHN